MIVPRLLIAGRALRNHTRNQEPLDPHAVRSILTCEVTRLGDVLTTIPALRHLRSMFPHARILSVVDERYATLLDACETGVDFAGVSGSDTIAGLLSSVRTARRFASDLALSLTPAKRNVAITLASGAPKVAGYLHPLERQAQHLHEFPVEAQGFALAQNAAYGSEHIEQRALHVAEALLGQPAEVSRMITLRTETRWQALSRLREYLPALDVPFIAVHPFAAWKFREWPRESVLALSRALLKQYEFRLVLVGELSEKARLDAIMNALERDDRISVFPSSDVLLTAALLEKAELFIGNDSGPLHLAALLGTPVVGLFGPATPAMTAPKVPESVFLYEQVQCSPCAQTTCLQPEDHCMGRITPAAVLTAVDRLLLSSRHQHVTAHGK